MKKGFGWLVVWLIVFYGLALTGCSSGGEGTSGGSGAVQGEKLKVVASIYPVYNFAQNVGGDKIEVSCLVPPGAEPHDWEPSPKDIIEMQSADVFVYCGAGMEQWVTKALETLDKPEILKVDASKGVELIAGSGHHHHGADESEAEETAAADEHEHGSEAVHDDDAAHEEEHEHENDADHEESHEHETVDMANADPHIWVDLLNAAVMVDNIAAALMEADPDNHGYYEQNAAAYRAQLMELHEEYQDKLAGARGKEFITSHAAFGYLAHRYGLIQVPLRGLSAEAEPTPARMAEVVELVREKNIRYIFFESLVSPKVSEVIAAEAGAETLVLNPVEGLTAGEMAAGKDYLAVMRENLVNLQKSFGISI